METNAKYQTVKTRNARQYGYVGGKPVSRLDPRGLAGQLTPNDIFNPNGTLTSSILQSPMRIIAPEDIMNPLIPSGFGKYTTPNCCTSSGTYETHYYCNSTTQ